MDVMSPSSPLVERSVCTPPPALFTMSEILGDIRSLPDVRSFSAPVSRDEESKKETLKYFLEWLRNNNLIKTEKMLLTEFQDVVTTPVTECAEPIEGVTFEAEVEESKEEPVEEEKVEEEVKEVDSWESPDDPGFIRILARPGDEFYELWSEEVGRAYFAQHGIMPPFEGKADNVPPPQSVPCDEAYYRQYCAQQQQWDAAAYAAYAQQQQVPQQQQQQQPGVAQQQQQQYQQQLVQQQMAYAAYYAQQQQPAAAQYDYSKDPMTAYYNQVQQQQMVQQQAAMLKYPQQGYADPAAALPQLQALPEVAPAAVQQPAPLPRSPQAAPQIKQIDIVTVDPTQEADAPATNSEDDESRNISMDVTEVSASDASTLALAEIEAQIQAAGNSVHSAPNTPLSSLLGQHLQAQFGEAVVPPQQQGVHSPYDPSVVADHAAMSAMFPAPEGTVMEHYPNLSEAAKPAKEPVFEAFELKVIYETGRTGFEEHKDYPIRTHAVIAGRYQVLEYLGAAAFSRAVQCVDLKTGQLVCIKIIRNSKDFFDQSLDEIKLLQYINSRGDPDEKCVLQLYDYFYHKEHLFLVCELLRDNLYEFSKYNRETGDEPYFTIPRLQKISKQVLTALEFVHSLNLIHCDLKPENILIKSYSRCEVKVIDFGSSCYLTDHLSSYVQSRCYRAPEVVLGLPYNNKIDLWSLGCILAELFTGRVLFQNDSISTMMVRIVAICGDLPEKVLRKAKYGYRFYTKRGLMFEKHPKSGQLCYLYPKRTKLAHRLQTDDELFLDFVTQLLQLDADKRPSATEALQHPFLKNEYGPISYN